MTYGTLKLRLTKAFPGISLDLIEGWINDRYEEILGELPWSRLNVQAVLETTAPYITGTVSVTLGSNAVVGTGTTWTSAMSGRAFRVPGAGLTGDGDSDDGGAPPYTFTYVSATTATLDRTFEGPSAATAAYSISQSIYPMPAACRMLEANAFSSFFGRMERLDRSQLNQTDPQRTATGTPQAWVSTMDDSSVPPNMQVELWPTPDRAIGIPFTYQSEPAELTQTTSPSLLLQVWLQPTALIEGVTARIKLHLKDYAGAPIHLGLAKAALANMRGSEAQGMAPAQLALGDFYTGYRRKRWCR